jgi:hypothetical protein
MRVRIYPVALAAAGMALSGCASHIISSARDDGSGAAGQAYRVQDTSIAGRSGLSSHGATGYVTRDECRNEGLTRVEVRRDLGQGLITLLTLGIVSPVTIHFYCDKPPTPPEGDDGGGEEF